MCLLDVMSATVQRGPPPDRFLKPQAEHSCCVHKSQDAMTALDPVCGMTFIRAKAAATAKQCGQAYYFCSTQCQQKFVADPSRYLKEAVPMASAAATEGTEYTCPMHPEVSVVASNAIPAADPTEFYQPISQPIQPISLSGSAAQQATIKAALLARCTFPFNRLKSGLQQAGKSSINISWRPVSDGSLGWELAAQLRVILRPEMAIR